MEKFSQIGYLQKNVVTQAWNRPKSVRHCFPVTSPY